MFIVGIAGGTGSGKTTLVSHIAENLPAGKVVVIPQDAYYKDNSHIPFEKRRDINFDHPDSVDFDLLIRHVKQLKKGRPVRQPVYSFLTCTRSARTLRVNPAPVIILEGILVLTNKDLGKLIDIKVFVDASPGERLARIIRRDREERGRSETEVLDRYERTVKPMHLQFIEPSRQFADFIVRQDGEKGDAAGILATAIMGRINNDL